MTDWEVLTLEQAGVTLLDCDHKTPAAREAGRPYVGIPQMTTGRVVFETARKISEEDYVQWTRKTKYQTDDVILSRRTNPGVTAVDDTGTDFALGQNLVLLRADGTRVRPDFLRWMVHTPQWWEQIDKYLNVGAVFSSLKCRDVPKFELTVPPIAEQNKINSILRPIADKIELNRRMNETLEGMARALFRDWFVDFGPTRRQMDGATDPAAIMGHAFPPEKAATLAPLFPTKLGNDGLPEGWETSPLDQIGDFLNGLALQKYPAQDGKPDLPVIKIAELRNGVSAKSNRASTDVPEKYVIGNGDFIFSWSGSLMAKFWTGGAGALNQHLFKVTSEGHPMWFVSEWVQTHLEEFQRIAASKAVTMGHIKRSHLAEAMCVCPSDEALATCGQVFDPLIAKQIANDEENQTLAALRDLLLPKLMSGEIRLKDAEAET